MPRFSMRLCSSVQNVARASKCCGSQGVQLLRHCRVGTGGRHTMDPPGDGSTSKSANMTLHRALDQIIEDAKQQVTRIFTKREGELLQQMRKITEQRDALAAALHDVLQTAVPPPATVPSPAALVGKKERVPMKAKPEPIRVPFDQTFETKKMGINT